MEENALKRINMFAVSKKYLKLIRNTRTSPKLRIDDSFMEKGRLTSP
jgi:hypothetical protein